MPKKVDIKFGDIITCEAGRRVVLCDPLGELATYNDIGRKTGIIIFGGGIY